MKVNNICIKENTNLLFDESSSIILDIQNDIILNIVVEKGSVIEILNIQKIPINAKININIKEGSKVLFNNVGLVFGTLKIAMNFNLMDNKSEIDFSNIDLCKESEHIYDINMVNSSDNTKGNIYQKAIADLNGQIKFHCTGKVEKNLKGCENFQESRVLLLDKASKGEVDPILLIDSYDLQAGHKASVSRVDDEQIYYLQTRGIDKETGNKILTYAFINSVIDRFNSNIKDKIKEEIHQLLEV